MRPKKAPQTNRTETLSPNYGQNPGSKQEFLTLAPLLVQRNDLVDELHAREAPPLGLPDSLGVIPLLLSEQIYIQHPLSLSLSRRSRTMEQREENVVGESVYANGGLRRHSKTLFRCFRSHKNGIISFHTPEFYVSYIHSHYYSCFVPFYTLKFRIWALTMQYRTNIAFVSQS